MSNLLDLALSHTARGFHVLPLKPRDKSPIVSGGCHAATTEENQVRAWWTKSPQANVGIGCGASNKAVLDIDHGLNSLEDFHAWRMRNALPDTYTVRTGRRPEFGVQMYFDGAMPDVGEWKLDGCSGQVKSLTSTPRIRHRAVKIHLDAKLRASAGAYRVSVWKGVAHPPCVEVFQAV